MTHTNEHDLVRDYLSGDGTLDRDLIRSSFAENTDAQLADDLISGWMLDSPHEGDDGMSWLQRYNTSRQDIIDAIASARLNFDDTFPQEDAA